MPFAPASHELYASTFSSALGAMTPDVKAGLSPPVAISVDAMQTVFEAATGADVGSAVFGLTVDVVNEVAAAAAVHGGLGSFISSGGSSLGPALGEVAAALGGVLDMIPMVSGFVDIMIGAAAGYERAQEERARQIKIQAAESCGDKLAADRPERTGPTGVTPADMFRDVGDGSGSLSQGMPASSALGFVLLCGGMTRGGAFEFPRYPALSPAGQRGEAGHQAWLSDARRLWGPHIGIPAPTRRKMWALIEGIMAARRPYTFERVEPIGDQGRILFPILCDLLLHEHQDRGAWTPQSVQSLCSVATPICSRYVDFGAMFAGTILEWKHQVQPVGYTDWLAKAERESAAARARMMRGIIGLDAGRAVALVDDAESRQQPPPLEQQLSPLEGIALGTGMLGIGYASWTAVRRFGPKAKRR